MRGRILTLLMCSFILGLVLVAASVTASEAKPFAEKHVVLQISDADPFKQTLVLNVASNVIKFYGPDSVEVEIVAFGPGLRLLFKDNDHAGRIQSLVTNGVRFSACENTLNAMTKELGKKPALNDEAEIVVSGVVQIMDLVEKGFTLVKP